MIQRLIAAHWRVYLGAFCLFLLAPILGFTGWGRSFWFTLAVTCLVVFCLDILVHEALNKTAAPSHFLLLMLGLVMATHSLFALIYRYTAAGASCLTGGAPDFWNAFYFSGVTLFTVGYGDIVPKGDFRFTSIVQIYLGHLLIFTVVAWGLGHFASRRLKND